MLLPMVMPSNGRGIAIKAFLIWLTIPFLVAASAMALFGLSFWGAYAIAFIAIVVNGIVAEYADDWSEQ